jgi:signal transduction histidine kinase
VNAAYAISDTVHYAKQHFTDENGLPQNSVKYIAPDKAGFIWLATENGMVRCEGSSRFRVYNKNELNIMSSRISHAYPGNGGYELLACTELNEVLCIGKGKICVLDSTVADKAAQSYMKFEVDPEGTFSIAALPEVHKNNIKVRNYLLPLNKSSWFLVGKDSVVLMEKGRRTLSFYFRHAGPWRFFILDGQLHYLDEQGRVSVFSGARSRTAALAGDILHHPAFSARRQNMKLYWNLAAQQLFVYLDRSFYRLEMLPDGNINTSRIITGFDFDRNKITSFYYDTAHARLFLGSVTKGLFVFTMQPFRVLTSEREEEDEVYYAQARFGKGGLLTPQGVAFDSAGKPVMLPMLRKMSIWGDRFSIVTDPRGNIWYKSGPNLFKYNSTATALLWKWACPSRISQLYIGDDDRLWIGTDSSGLYCLSTAAARPSPAQEVPVSERISYVQHETRDVLWLAAGKGVYRVHLSTRQVDTIHHFNTRNIRSLNVSAPGMVWITTYDEGFFLYRNNRLTSFPLDREKYLSAVHCLVEGNRGSCWITTNKGLFQASKKDLLAYADGKQSYVYYHYYGKDKGFNTNEFNGGCQPCAVKWSNGDISLPSLDGLVFFTPDNIKPELPSAELFVEKAELNGNLMPWHDDTLALPHAFQQLKLHISVPYFGDPYNLQLSYRLTEAGGDTLWLPVGPDHTLSFSTLPSGTYRLQIRKINGFGKNNYTDKILVLTVCPAYYETYWFRLLAVLLVIIGVVVYIKLHTRHIKQQNQVLESRVSARTAELEAALASLSHSEKKLRRQARTQERLLASITHDIKTPMKYLMMLAGNMSWKEEARQEPTIVARSSKAIYDASYRMYYLVDNLIQYIRTHVKNGSAQPEEVDLHELTEEKIDIFSSIAETNNTVIVNEVPPDLQFCANYQALAVVLHNLLDNAVKNTREGAIIVSAISRGDNIVISIEDTGTGLPPFLLHWINEYWYPKAKEEESPAAHNGLGLIIVMELLEQMQGRLTAENKPHCGAILKIELPPC